MALRRKVNGRQWPLVAEVQLDLVNDTVIATDGTTKALSANAVVADLIPLPPDATVTHGELVVDQASNGTTHTLAVGDSALATRYLAATDLKVAARTAWTPTGYRGNGEDIRLTFAGTGTPTAGKISLRCTYVIADRANENSPT